MKTKIVFMVMLLAVSGESSSAITGSFINGDRLLDLCESLDEQDRGICTGYLMSISDTHDNLYTLKIITRNFFCLPATVNISQLRQSFIDYAAFNRYQLRHAAASVAMESFRKRYPCY